MRYLSIFLFFVLPSIPTYAWNGFGHELVAYVAWQNMTPEQRQTYTTILKAHPHYHDDLEYGIAADGKNHDEFVFMKAATWPDMVKGTRNADEKPENHPTWHYYDLPITPDGKDVPPPKIDSNTAEPTNAIEAIKFENFILKDKKAPPARRAIALCWMLHLVGDLHQPLHCVSLFDVDFPDGDRGGNSIHLANAKPGYNLHGLWDSILGTDDNPTEIVKAGDGCLKDNAAAVTDRAKDLETMDWVKEGRDLSVKVVYQGLELNETGELLKDTDRKTVSPNDEYLRRARETARSQAVLGGERLAAILTQDAR